MYKLVYVYAYVYKLVYTYIYIYTLSISGYKSEWPVGQSVFLSQFWYSLEAV